MSVNEEKNNDANSRSSEKENINGKNNAATETSKKKFRRSLWHISVNIFIGLTGFLILSLMLIIGAMQTNTFRNLVREKIIDVVNNRIKGTFFLEELNGTILTSLDLKNLGIIENSDTVFSAREISTSISLVSLFQKKILLRNISLIYPKVKIIEIEKGSLTFLREFNSNGKINEKDKAKNNIDVSINKKNDFDFPFTIEIANFNIKDGNFIYKDYLHSQSDSVYRHINYNDLNIKNFNLDLSAIINLNRHDFYVEIKNLFFDNNLRYFKLKNLSGNFHLNNKFTEVKNLHLKTDYTNIKCNVRMDDFSLLDSPKIRKDLPVKANIDIQNFNFFDLNSFLPSLDFLNGDVNGIVSVSGKYGEMNINELNLNIDKSNLKLKGKLLNLDKSKDLFIDAEIEGNIFYDNVKSLLAGISLPEFNNPVVNNLKLKYKGLPLKFNSEISANIDSSELFVKSFMDLTKDEISYDYEIETKNFNLQPLFSLKSRLNLNAKIKGKGFDLAKMNNEMEIKITNSEFENREISRLNLKTKSVKGNTSVNFLSEVNNSLFTVKGDFTLDSLLRNIDLYGKIKNMNLATLINNPDFASNLNLAYKINAENINTEKITTDVNIKFDSIDFRGDKSLSGSDFSFSIWHENSQNHIDLKSALIDVAINGNFNFDDLTFLLQSEGNRFSRILNNRLFAKITGEEIKGINVTHPNKETEINYNFVFNPSEFWAKLFDVKAFTIAGYSFGNISNSSSRFNFTNNTFVSNFIYINDEDVIYVDNASLNTKYSNSNLNDSFDSLQFVTSLESERIFSGNDYRNLKVSVSHHNNKIDYSVNTEIDSLFSIGSSGNLSAGSNEDTLNVDFLKLSVSDMNWENQGAIKSRFSNGMISVDNFRLKSDSSEFTFSGKVSTKEMKNSNLLFSVKNMKLENIEKMFMNDEIFKGVINGSFNLNGSFSSPEISTDLVCEDFSYKKIDFGNIFLKADYRNSRSYIDLKMLNNKPTNDSLILSLNGFINRSLFNESHNLDEEVNLHLISNDFNLAVFAPLTEDIRHIKGNLNADINLLGTIDNPYFNGFAELKSGKFYVAANGLDYIFNGNILFSGREILFRNFYLANNPVSGFNGKINLDGKIDLEKYKLSSVNLNIYGGLGLLSEKTKFVNPSFYGKLFVKTDGKWNLNISSGRARLSGKLKITDANITISSVQNTSDVDATNIEYLYVIDSTKITENKARKLLEKYFEAQLENVKNEEKNSRSFFDYDLNFEIENHASLNFIFSKVANQKLRAITTGSLKISSEEGENIAQGEFILLPGSRLDFFRTFEATGKIRFEREILNPYLDINAVYKGIHYKQSLSSDGTEEEEVAVKIKLKGLLQNLGKSLTTGSSKIAVYVGRKNIDNDIPDPKLDASDAMTFVLLGKFNNDLTSSEQYKFTNELASSATAMLGTVMGVFLNSALGGVINDVDISKTQTKTKVMLKGRLGKFYYSLGGSESVFENIAEATWKIEYFFNKNLSLRLERREPITGFISNKQMTDEIGIKYRVSF